MARIQKSIVTLRIVGDTLVPDEISSQLGCAPTCSHYKGEQLNSRTKGIARVARKGSWHLESRDREPEDIDTQVGELLAQLSNDLAVWRQLEEQFKIDLFCGLFMDSWNEGFAISPKSMIALGVRGITVSLDIYAPIDNICI